MLGWLPCPRVRYRMVDHQQPPSSHSTSLKPATRHPLSATPPGTTRHTRLIFQLENHVLYIWKGRCACRSANHVSESMWIHSNVRYEYSSEYTTVYGICCIHSRKNAIISVGCISIHLVALRRTRLTAHVFFFIFFDWRSSQKGATGRAYRSSDQASFQNWNYRKPKVWPLHKQKYRGVERLNGLIGGSKWGPKLI